MRSTFIFLVEMLAALWFASPAVGEEVAAPWVGTWASSPQPAELEAVLTPFSRGGVFTLRQVVRVSIGGKQLRLRLSNRFGKAPLTLQKVHLARARSQGEIEPGTDRGVTFAGLPSVTIPPGALIVSDPIDFDLLPLSETAISLVMENIPSDATTHPGSRTTSYFKLGDLVADVQLPAATAVDHWYFISGLEVAAAVGDFSVVILGDSIADGRGSTTNGQDRWPDRLAERFHAEASANKVGVLNEGIGGNRLLFDRTGPSGLARFDRDVLAQTGRRWVIISEGVNDLGTGRDAERKGEKGAADIDIIAGYEQLLARAHAQHLLVAAATILPFEGFTNYYSPLIEERRQKINQWIRTNPHLDGVIDFDAVMRDPTHPSRLQSEYDGGDHLHPNQKGYQAMAAGIDLQVFLKPAKN